MSDNKFVFITPMYNASKTLGRMLHSLFGQSYENWRVILIDDMSSQEERVECANIVNRFRTISYSDCKRIKIVWNDRKKWETENVLFGIKNYSEDDDVICRLDADDFLTDLDGLYILNEYYKETEAEVIWTSHRWEFSDLNISGPMPCDVDPYQHKWVSSHLKTFKRYLLNDIPDENFRGENGEYIRRAGDQALYLPVLYNTQKRLYVPRVMYHYNVKLERETFHTDDAKFQKNEAEFIRNRGYVKSGESWDKIIKC